MDITLTVRGAERLQRALQRLERRTGNIKPALQDIGELLIERTRQRFRDGENADGSDWEALSPVTLARREAAGISGTKPGIAEARRLSTEWVYQIAGDGLSLVFGSPLIQAGVFTLGAERHSFTGGKTPWGDIPARDPITPSAATEQDLIDIVGDYLTGDL